MAATDQALQALKDIHLPAPVASWPWAPGWYLLIGILIVVVLLAAWIFYRYQRRRRHKQVAFKTLVSLEQHYHADASAEEILAAISILLRRVALAYFPRRQVAALHGQAWCDFLQSVNPKVGFSQQQAELLSIAPYQARVTVDLTELFITLKHWLKTLPLPIDISEQTSGSSKPHHTVAA